MSARFLQGIVRFYYWANPVFADVGTSLLAIAALFFVRAFPATPSVGFDYWLLGASFAFFLVGIVLRAAFRE